MAASTTDSTKGVPARARRRVTPVSLGARVALVTVASAVIAVFVAGVSWLPMAQDAAQQRSVASLNHLADATVAAIDRRAGTGTGLAGTGLQEVLASEDVSVFLSAPGHPVPSFLPATDAHALAEGFPTAGEAVTAAGPVIFAARPLTGGGVLALTQPTAVSRQIPGEFVATIGRALAAGAVIAALIGMLLARRLTEPLRAAAEGARRLGRGERHVALRVNGPREVVEVTAALAELQQALTVSEGRAREFLLSISHELRTPLTAIGGYAEALADGVVVEPSDVLRTGVIVAEEAERLDRLVSDLLDLARLDRRDFVILPTEVDFTDLGAKAAAVWADRCRAEGVRFRADLPDGPVIGSTDAVRVRQIIDNLAANALRVTPAGRDVVLHLSPQRDQVVIELRDGGPGLTEEDCEVAFEPAVLYTRYRGIRRVGTGVGLALVGRLAHLLGGQAVAGAAPEGGARITVTVARSVVDPARRVAP